MRVAASKAGIQGTSVWTVRDPSGVEVSRVEMETTQSYDLMREGKLLAKLGLR